MAAPRQVTFRVFGNPQPKGSAKAFVIPGTRRAIVTSTNRNVKGWESAIRHAAQTVAGGTFFDDAVGVHITFAFQRPKSVSPKRRPFHTTRPDLDKLLRSTIDSMTGILWRDDAQVTAIVAEKTYARDSEPSSALITITEISPAERTHQKPALWQGHDESAN